MFQVIPHVFHHLATAIFVLERTEMKMSLLLNCFDFFFFLSFWLLSFALS